MNLLLRCLSMLFLLAWMVLGTFRSSGLDYVTYLKEFIDPVNNLTSYEVGYVALMSAVRPLGGFWIVLLIANTTFFVAHLKVTARIVSWPQAAVFMFYLSYVGLFLIYGSPRRLIAFALISHCLFVLAFQREKFRAHPWRHAVITGVAASFHVSALVFVPVLVAYTYGLSLFSSARRILLIVGAMAVVGGALYAGGAIDYIDTKIGYYLFYAAAEQEYLDEVPSVTSGLIKRFLAISLIWYGMRQAPGQRRPLLDLCLIEAFLYGALGSLSPVLAVVSSYFSVAYLIPALRFRRANEALSLRGLMFMTAAALYFVPTALGLIRLFGHEYSL